VKKLSKGTKIVLAVLIVAVVGCGIFLLLKYGIGQSSDTDVTSLAMQVEVTGLTVEKTETEGLNGILFRVSYEVPQVETDLGDHVVQISVVYPEVYSSTMGVSESAMIPLDFSGQSETAVTTNEFGEYSIDLTDELQDEIVSDIDSFQVRVYADDTVVQELSYDDIVSNASQTD
jgi:hypothetical protein